MTATHASNPNLRSMVREYLQPLLAVHAVRQDENGTRIYTTVTGKEIIGTPAFVAWLRNEIPMIGAYATNSVQSEVNRQVRTVLGNVFVQGERKPRGGTKHNLAQLAKAELKRRLGAMSITELLKIAKS